MTTSDPAVWTPAIDELTEGELEELNRILGQAQEAQAARQSKEEELFWARANAEARLVELRVEAERSRTALYAVPGDVPRSKPRGLAKRRQKAKAARRARKRNRG